MPLIKKKRKRNFVRFDIHGSMAETTLTREYVTQGPVLVTGV